METSSPLSLFEAVFKVIEERLAFGRHIVTILASLMAAVILVFCVGYLGSALIVAANWAVLSFKAKSIQPLSHLSTGTFFPWWLIALIWTILGTPLYKQYKVIEQMSVITDKLKQNNALIENLPHLTPDQRKLTQAKGKASVTDLSRLRPLVAYSGAMMVH